MVYDGYGGFDRQYNWVADRDADIRVRSDKMDIEMDGFATGLSNCILKDGQQVLTANIPWNDYKITGLGDATADKDALNRISADVRYVPQTGLSTVTVAADDLILIADTSDSGAMKLVASQSVGDLGGSGGGGDGDQWGDAVDADIIPDADGTRDLGADATRFAGIYTDALDVTGNLVTGGTVNTRNMVDDGAKLDNMETAATADQTGAEIKTLYEGEADTNAFTDANQTKLAAIEASADVTDEANVKAALDGATISTVTLSTDDLILIQDTSDGGALKEVDPQEIADMATTVATDMALGSDAQGDVAYFDGSNYTRLAAGTSGQFLKTQGTGNNPTWETIPGGGDMLAANNLSDVSSLSEARSNLDVPSLTDFFEHELRIVDLEGDALGTPNRIADQFGDETDVDTGNCINQVYNAVDGSYAPNNGAGTDLVPTMTAATTGGVTVTASSEINGTNLAYKAFDDVDPVNTGSTTMWHTGVVGGVGVLGVDFGSATLANKYTMTAAAGANVSNAPTSFTFEGSDDESAWDVLDTQSGLSWSILEKKEFNLAASENYRYYRFNITVAGGGTYIVIGECEIMYAAMTNMTLVSNAFTALSAPDNARLLFLIKPNEAIVLNAGGDVVGAVSRDGGTNFTDAVLVEKIAWSNGYKLYEAENVDISAQPSGTSLKWKLTHDNGKDIRVSAVILQWSE